MKISQITQFLESIAPLALQESYDNSGLITGNQNDEATGALICIDVTDEVIDEAIELGINLIISHHPLVFGGIKKFSGQSIVERLLVKAIKNDIALYAGHTNFDSLINRGVNAKIAEKIGLVETRILAPAKELLNKLVVFVPKSHAEKVRQVIFNAGGGQIGQYSHCSFNSDGKGIFMAGEKANPYVGKIGQIHFEEEIRIETIVPRYLSSRVISAMLNEHPYEEAAYDIYPLQNNWQQVGSGLIGRLEKPVEPLQFLNHIKEVFHCGCIRHTALTNAKIEKIAVCGGSGSFLINDAIKAGADLFITADMKYHQFFEVPKTFILADIGHYESEQFTKELFYELLIGNFSNFAVRLTKINTNPIKYV